MTFIFKKICDHRHKLIISTTTTTMSQRRMIKQTSTKVLNWWFEGVRGPEMTPVANRWWAGDDKEVIQLFQNDLETAVKNPDAFKESAHSRLAFIIMCDQFSRSIYRGSGRSFENDALALAFSKEGIELKQDLELDPPQRMFFYMPFMHSEDLETSEQGIKVFQQLAQDAETSEYKTYDWEKNCVGFMIGHTECIRRFGRFPKRNAALGRKSTPEEEEYVAGREGMPF
jgi:uncharacterized protein (DUF924 family)